MLNLSLGNRKLHLHSLSFLKTDSVGSQNPFLWLTKTLLPCQINARILWRKGPGQKQTWYWATYPKYMYSGYSNKRVNFIMRAIWRHLPMLWAGFESTSTVCILEKTDSVRTCFICTFNGGTVKPCLSKIWNMINQAYASKISISKISQNAVLKHLLPFLSRYVFAGTYPIWRFWNVAIVLPPNTFNRLLATLSSRCHMLVCVLI